MAHHDVTMHLRAVCSCGQIFDSTPRKPNGTMADCEQWIKEQVDKHFEEAIKETCKVSRL